jgi:hypothetical protein
MPSGDREPVPTAGQRAMADGREPPLCPPGTASPSDPWPQRTTAPRLASQPSGTFSKRMTSNTVRAGCSQHRGWGLRRYGRPRRPPSRRRSEVFGRRSAHATGPAFRADLRSARSRAAGIQMEMLVGEQEQDGVAPLLDPAGRRSLISPFRSSRKCRMCVEAEATIAACERVRRGSDQRRRSTSGPLHARDQSHYRRLVLLLVASRRAAS